MPRPRPLRIGVLGTEFFDESLGRMGGFGWAARQVVRVLQGRGDPPIEVVLLAGSRQGPDGELVGSSHGVRLVYGSGDARRDTVRFWRERLDLLITVDWSRRYLGAIRSLPRTPVLVWARDPRPPSVAAEVATLELPDGTRTSDAVGSLDPDPTIRELQQRSRRYRRPVGVAAVDEFLLSRFREQYGVDVPDDRLLPNPLTIERTRPRADDPVVAYVGRLDPVKRPWLVLDLARRHPEVRFELAGGRYLDEWAPDDGDVPPNVVLVGHLEEDAKADLLSRAWCLVNTSIHEGLPVSACEALRVGTPLLATVPAGGVVARFGIFVGRAGGAGLELVPALDEGLRRLVDDHDLRRAAGAEGQAWATARHSVASFLAALPERLREAGAGPLADDIARRVSPPAGAT